MTRTEWRRGFGRRSYIAGEDERLPLIGLAVVVLGVALVVVVLVW